MMEIKIKHDAFNKFMDEFIGKIGNVACYHVN